MSGINYFSALCFLWAAVGITTRILMVTFGDKWIKWELEKAYSKKKPKWIYTVAAFSLFIVGFTWYKVIETDIQFGWVIAVLVSLTLIKIFTLIFDYQKFREFAKEVLNNKRKQFSLNIGVIIFSMAFILMGVYLY